MSLSFRFIISFVIIICFTATVFSQRRDLESAEPVVKGSLAELKGKHRVWLIVRRGAVLDARGAEASVLSEVYREGNLRPTFPRTFNQIARKLNKYMKEYGSITAAPTLSEAEFIIFFNVLEIRRPLGAPYAYGEMFVVLNTESRPRIIWKTRSKGVFVDDAISDLLSELKAARGEK